jgi:hypothetical protein
MYTHFVLLYNAVEKLYIFFLTQTQKVLNDLERTRLSRRNMNWLHPHPSPQHVVSLSRSLRIGNELANGGGVGVGEEPNHTRGEKALVIYESFNNICTNIFEMLKIFAF